MTEGQTVTATFSVSELATLQAALILFRRDWAREYRLLTGEKSGQRLAQNRIETANLLMHRLEDMTTDAQKTQEYSDNAQAEKSATNGNGARMR